MHYFIPAGTRFYDVEGVPVTVEPTGRTLAWDSRKPRWFPLGSVDRNGTQISEACFRARRLEELRARELADVALA